MAATNYRKRYALVGAVFGGLLGYMLADSFGLPAALGVLYVLVGALVGVGVALYLHYKEPPEESAQIVREEARPTGPISAAIEVSESDRRGGSSTTRFLAVSGRGSVSGLVSVKVPQVRVARAPQLQTISLMVEPWDQVVRVPVLEGALAARPLEEVLERVSLELSARSPKVGDQQVPQLRCCGWRSEGPVTREGACPQGWSFRFVDPAWALGALAVVTDKEIWVHFFTTIIAWTGREGEALPLTALYQRVLEQLPSWSERPCQAMGFPVHDVFLQPLDGSWVLDVDGQDGKIRNLAWAEALRQAPSWAGFVWSDVVATLWPEVDRPASGSDEKASRAALSWAAYIEEQGGLGSEGRSWSQAQAAHVADGLWRYHGAAIGELLLQEVSTGGDHPPAGLALLLLERLPTRLSLAWLHRLCGMDLDPETRLLAEERLAACKRRWIDEDQDNVLGGELLESRRRMGKDEHLLLALRATYRPEPELWAGLERAGLKLVRERRLCGSSGLALAGLFRSPRGETEAWLLSAPLHMPCHVLYVFGQGREAIAQRVEREGLLYRKEAWAEDVASERPMKLYRAALYGLAMGWPFPQGSAPLRAAFSRIEGDKHTRAAFYRAIAMHDEPEGIEFLRARLDKESTEDGLRLLQDLVGSSGRRVDPPTAMRAEQEG